MSRELRATSDELRVTTRIPPLLKAQSSKLVAHSFRAVIRSAPMYGRNTSGMTTLPSAC